MHTTVLYSHTDMHLQGLPSQKTQEAMRMKWPLSSKLTPTHYRRNLFFRLLLGLLGFLLGFPLGFLL